jgi:hypothetical protein
MKDLWENLKLLLFLFLDWGFKKKLLLISGSIAFFPLYILGEIYLNINIPSGSIENSFSSYLPIMTNKILIDSIFSWIFLIKVIFPFIIGILIQRNWSFIHLYREKIIAGIFILFIGMLFITIRTIPDKDWALKAYIEISGYPKVIQNNGHYYTLLGPNKEAYDLNKSLTAERCTYFDDANKSSPPEVYYSLIRKMGNDFDTYPSSAKTLEGYITFFDYNESLNLIKTLCNTKKSN